MKLYQIFLLLVCFFALPQAFLSAPDPSEVEELKKESSLYIEGFIVKDSLLKENKETNTQLRMMEVVINHIFHQKFSTPASINQIIQVEYHYLPNWVDYSGGGSIQVIEGDRLKLWLNKDDNSLTPILGTSGVEILQENGPRIEHIKEPFIHKVTRIWRASWTKYSSSTVFFIMLFSLVLIMFAAFRSKKH